jgi:16S rRNA (uracil1498-N3)-methyltransferase
LFVTNGNGQVYKCEVSQANDKKCLVSILETTTQKPLKYNLHLAVAPTKMNDRYEWFLEKATEIGITEITPILCDHSERKVIKAERFEKIIQSATKQSLSAYKPVLNEAVSFKNFVENNTNANKFIAHCEETDKKSLKKELQPHTDYLILIGPEGDFSQKEIDLALKHNFIPVTLGETRLRTETAAIVACHSVAFVNEL